MAENTSAYEDLTKTTSATTQQQQQKGQQQSHIKKVLNNINNKFSSSTTSSTSSSPPPPPPSKMNTTTATTNSNSNTGIMKTHALKHSTGNINSGQNRNITATDNNKHHHHHQHHHHHHHHNNPYVIHKTTTESIRLANDLFGNNSNSSNNLSSSSSSTTSSSSLNNSNLSTGNMTVHQLHLSTAPLSSSIRKPCKASSFQITSVTVGNKLSADNGEDSADDLDESHTDDNSRVTDFENETPSVSEDTFSKEDVFFSSNALGTAPVIPTSSQYGLVIVDPELGCGVGGTGQNLQNVHVSVMDAGINIVGPGSKLGDVDQKELQHRNERFKVVKIESTEPFKRGRWVCMDYLDHTTLQQRNNENSNNNEKLNHCNTSGDGSNGDDGGGNGGAGGGGGTSETALTNDSGVNVSENHIDSIGESSDGNTQQQISYHNSPGQTMKHPISIPIISSSNPNSGGAGSNSVGPNDIQNLNGITNVSSIHAQNMQHVPNVVSSQQPSLMMSAATSGNVQNNINVIGQIPGTIQQQIPPVNDIILPPLNTETTNYVPGQSQPQIYLNQQQPQQNNVQQVHGATLPANMQIQNGIPNLTSTQQQQQQSQSSLPQVISSINVSMPIVVPSSNNITTVDTHNINMPSSQPIIMQQPIQHPQSINQQQQQQQSINQNQQQQDIFVQSQPSASQSYSGNTVTANLINSGAIQQQEIQQQIDNQQQQLNIANQTLQSGIVSPSSIGAAGMTSNIDAIQQQHQTNNMAGQSLPNVKITEMNVQQTSAPATINEAAVIISNSIQAQQQQQIHGQTQQSGSEDNNQQSQPMETDSERVSRLTLTLSKSENHPISTNFIITSEPSTTFQTSFISDVGKKENRYNNNNFTNLALGHSMNRILGSSSKFNQLNKIIKDKSQSMENERGGIPIPIRQQNTNDIPSFVYSYSPDNKLSSYYGYSNNFVSDQQPKIAGSYEIPKNEKISSSQMNSIALPSVNLNIKARRASAFSSASGASAVAIDNKIEQAMDLVKSHLMIAVREEVEVLKEKIAELMDRINQLEVENTILKANVSQETLNQLQLQGSVQSVQSTSTTQPATNITSAVPTTTNPSNGLVP